MKSDDSTQPTTPKQKKINRDLLLPTVSKFANHNVTTLLEDCERLLNEVETCFESTIDKETSVATDAIAVFKSKNELAELLEIQSICNLIT